MSWRVTLTIDELTTRKAGIEAAAWRTTHQEKP